MESGQKCLDKSRNSSRCRTDKRKLNDRESLSCHCKMAKASKDSGKSEKSRVWRKVMWFSRKSKSNNKLDCSQCGELDNFHSEQVSHSNSWSFTRSATKRFRISSRKRRCKSDTAKRSSQKLASSSRDAHLTVQATNTSPTATGSFCDFGTSSTSSLGRSRKGNHTLLLTEIARELNPPADIPLQNYQPDKQLQLPGKNVHRSESFPRYYPSNSRLVQSYVEANKDKAGTLQRRATCSDMLNTGFMTTQMRKSLSTNTITIQKDNHTLKGSPSLGEIQDQDGSIIGIVHFYKSPKNNCVRQLSSSTLACRSPDDHQYHNSRLNSTLNSHCPLFETHCNSVPSYYNSNRKELCKTSSDSLENNGTTQNPGYPVSIPKPNTKTSDLTESWLTGTFGHWVKPCYQDSGVTSSSTPHKTCVCLTSCNVTEENNICLELPEIKSEPDNSLCVESQSSNEISNCQDLKLLDEILSAKGCDISEQNRIQNCDQTNAVKPHCLCEDSGSRQSAISAKSGAVSKFCQLDNITKYKTDTLSYESNAPYLRPLYYVNSTNLIDKEVENLEPSKEEVYTNTISVAIQISEYCLESAIEMNFVWHKVTSFEPVTVESLLHVVCSIQPTDVACEKKLYVKVTESSNTSDYASCSDEDLSTQNDISISTWTTSSESTELKDTDLRPPVPGKVFKMRTELMLGWFEEFNDEQKNIVIKKLLDHCDLPQMHLLSVAMEPNLHKTCPPNCQDMLVWLPYPVTVNILLYLDVVSLCRCNQVNKAWNELTNNPLLWQQLARSPDYQLSEAGNKKLYKKYTGPNGEIHWKKVLAERFLLQKKWLNGKYTLKTFNGHNQGIACVQFDDTRIVSGSSDKTIKLWDISNETSQLMLTLAGHSGTVRCLHLNGNRLVSGSTDRTIKVWDLSFASYWAGASCKVTMVGHLHTVRCLQADEKKLVSGSYDKTVKVWDLKTGQCQLTLRGHTAAVLCVQFDDQKIVSGSYDKKIKVWDLNEGTCLMTLDGHHDAVTCLNLTHDGMKIITGSLDYSLKFWDLHTGKCYGTLDWITSEGHTAVVRCLQVDSWRIISGGDDKTLKVWELTTGQRLLTLRYHSDGVTCMQFNDFAIVSGSYDRTVKLWDFTPKHPYLDSVT